MNSVGALNYVLPVYSASERESLLFGLAYANVQQFLPILNEVKWTQEATKSLQDSIFNGPQVYYCIGDNEVSSIYILCNSGTIQLSWIFLYAGR